MRTSDAQILAEGERISKIQIGMTEAQAETAAGPPARILVCRELQPDSVDHNAFGQDCQDGVDSLWIYPVGSSGLFPFGERGFFGGVIKIHQGRVIETGYDLNPIAY